jgi:hypothetical protein
MAPAPLKDIWDGIQTVVGIESKERGMRGQWETRVGVGGNLWRGGKIFEIEIEKSFVYCFAFL